MKKKTAQCAVCGGRLVERSVKYDQHWGEQIVVFEDVPARVCLSCGETWLSAKVINMMEKILTKQRKPQRKITVPVWSLAVMKAA